MLPTRKSVPRSSRQLDHMKIFFFVFTYPLTVRVIRVPQMISQPVSSIFLCLPGLGEIQACQIPDVVFPTSFSLCLVFFPLSMYVARWL